MSIDGVTLGILSHYFRAAAEAAGYTLERTAYTTFIKESNDFTTGLVTPRGEHFAYPAAIGAQSYVGIDFSPAIKSLEPWEEDDIGVANCPYLTKGMSTHLPDYHLMKPVFAEGKLIAFAWAFIHSSDMGGIVAGSILPSTYEMFQEGLRIPPKKLFRKGRVQEDVKDFLLANVRIPEKNWGDLNAVAAALGTAERRIQEAVRKWGLDTVEEGMEALIDYAEARARSIISRFPGREFVFQDYLEDDVVSDMPVRVKLRVTKEGEDGLHFDFTGTDPQVGAAFNIASAGRHPFLCGALFGYLRSIDPTIPVNAGLMRPVRITAPEGSVVNSVFPAPVGVRYAVTQLNYGIVQGIIAQALPKTVPAAGAGQATILAISLMEPESGKRHITVVQPMIGGSGGRDCGDGIDGCDFSLGSLANTPIESIENEVPIVIREYSVVPDSGGPGEHRGGMALRLDFQVFHPDTIVTARGMERFKFQPWGLYGGRAGAAGDCWLNPGDPREKHLGKINLLRLEAGDTFSVRSPGGGGYGNPLDRPPESVLEDVRDEVVTVRAAEREYGVVIADDSIDQGATEKLRRRLRNERKPVSNQASVGDSAIAAGIFDRGAARNAHESLFTMEFSDALAALLYSLPPGIRYYAKQKMYARVRETARSTGQVNAEVLQKLWNEELSSMGLKFPAPSSVE